tara:strand:+ start:3141 stop:4226 length:1086 start_codon:yes stop_codon:yes gene_type:complete
MKDYLFILGRDEDLSYLELLSYLQSRKIKYNVVGRRGNAVVLSLGEFSLSNAILDLGGIVKIGEVLGKVEDLDSFSLYEGKSNNIRYGVLGFDEDISYLFKYLKRRFKEEKLKAVYKPHGFTPSSFKEGMIEFLLFDGLVFRVVAVFGPKIYKARDLGRPRNDFKRNISIRLAKIMINLSGVKRGDRLLDPFCGVGVVLQEAGLMGCNVVGVDKDKNMVKASFANMKWLGKEVNNWKIVKGDSSQIDKYVSTGFDSIVTEPDLGTYWKKLPGDEEAKKELKRLEKLYADFLIEVKGLLKRQGRLVMVVPVFKTKTRKRMTMDFESLSRDAGFKKFEICDVKIPYVYNKRGSKIDREIWVLG